MLFQGQDDAVGNDGGEDHPLKRSEEAVSRGVTFLATSKVSAPERPDTSDGFAGVRTRWRDERGADLFEAKTLNLERL